MARNKQSLEGTGRVAWLSFAKRSASFGGYFLFNIYITLFFYFTTFTLFIWCRRSRWLLLYNKTKIKLFYFTKKIFFLLFFFKKQIFFPNEERANTVPTAKRALYIYIYKNLGIGFSLFLFRGKGKKKTLFLAFNIFIII